MVAKTRRAVKRNRKQTKKRSRRGGAPPTLARNVTPSQAFAQKKRMAREQEMKQEMRAAISGLIQDLKELRISTSEFPGFDQTAAYLAVNPTVKTTGALNALISQGKIRPALLNTPLQMIVSIGRWRTPSQLYTDQLDIDDVMIRGVYRDGPVYSVDPYNALFFMVWLDRHAMVDREPTPYKIQTSDELFKFEYTDKNSQVDIELRPMPRTPGERIPEESLAGRMGALTMNEGFPVPLTDAEANPFSPAEFRAATQTPRTATKSQGPKPQRKTRASVKPATVEPAAEARVSASVEHASNVLGDKKSKKADFQGALTGLIDEHEEFIRAKPDGDNEIDKLRNIVAANKKVPQLKGAIKKLLKSIK